jgi:hypothetical protein
VDESIPSFDTEHQGSRPINILVNPLNRLLTEIDRKIADLSALRTELDRVISSCRHGTVANCKIIETLGPR